MGIHEWSYKNAYAPLKRTAMPHADKAKALRDLKVEVELGFDDKLAAKEAERCLNCDVQTVFSAPLCIECDACMDVCPVDCINFIRNDDEPALRRAARPGEQPGAALYVSEPVKTAASWPRTRTCASIAGCAPSAARRARGT
jgi:ferredoxin